MRLDGLIVCNQCDLLLREVELEPGAKASCSRCGNELYRLQPNGLQRSLAFGLTAAALFLVSNAFPIVTINSQGLTNSTTLLDAADRLVRDGIPSIAALVFATTFLMPMLEILALIYLLLPLNLGRLPPFFPLAFRVVHLWHVSRYSRSSVNGLLPSSTTLAPQLPIQMEGLCCFSALLRPSVG